MRGTPSLLLLVMLAACGEQAAPPVTVDQSEAASALASPPTPGPVQAPLEQTAQRALATDDPAAITRLRQSPALAARALLQAADGGSVLAQGRAPLLLARLGSEALPALELALRDASPTQRRIAALASLQLGALSRPLANALLAARNDADASVRAVAELAWQAAVGDRGDLYRLHAEHDAALQPR